MFIRDPKDVERMNHQKHVEQDIKDRLYDMYQRGELKKR
jgi:hypothetical protein